MRTSTRRENTTSRAATLDRITTAGRTLAARGPGDNCSFLEAFYASAADEELAGNAATLAAAALDQLEWGAQRQRGRPKVRVFNPDEDSNGWTSAHTIIETITEDSPFLVDSITMRLGTLGYGVLTNNHPVLRVTRDSHGRLSSIDAATSDSGTPESWMQIAIPRIVDAGRMRKIRSELTSTLADVRLAVRDWKQMLEKLAEAGRDLDSSGRTRGMLRTEMRAFVDWLADNNFTFLGYCRYRHDADGMTPVAESGLGLLRSKRGLQETATDGDDVLELRIAKAAFRSTIHRPAPLDDISIMIFDEQGAKRCEHRFLGLFTSVAYTESPADIPLVRTKIRAIMTKSGLDPVSHKGKALQHILNTLPRDELLQASIAELKATALGVLALEDRRRVRLFARLDGRRNFYSCLVYLPRDEFGEDARERIEAVLAEGLGGPVADSQVTIGEAALARIAITVAVTDASPRQPDLAALESALVDAATSWPERVRTALLERYDEATALELHGNFSERFPLGYQEAVTPERATRDLPLLAQIDAGEADILTVLEPAPVKSELSFTVVSRDASVPLYLANPILEHMGLRVRSERNYRVPTSTGEIWIQDFDLAGGDKLDGGAEDLADRFQSCFVETLAERVENDGFNSLVIHAGLDWREADLLRAYCKYVLQTRLRFSQAYMIATLNRYPILPRALIDFFSACFDPDLGDAERESRRARSQSAIRSELDRAVSLDDDRILRAFTAVVQATLRTNYYQLEDGEPKPYISFKLDPSRIPDLPKPRPKFEIFVFSRRVEGVHLRCGDVARGGLRWSDRREDFRTEVLGLMKAQQVKNTVIVPTGAKGGFVCKLLPEGDRAAVLAEVTDCYRTFLRGLLDITDNVVGENVVTPERVIARDGKDPYLVVAADKGTATFSDIANGISAEYGFWLGDAFASGGSAGYDHKKMGITARGAWESVKRHFRELGLDTQTEDFTVVGIGDMAGDVFGNGMLLSPHIRLVAAFNHLHIFIDPNPDAKRSFTERQRLFALPRSSWEDYDQKLLSPGGGIYRRDAKSIPIGPEARAALGIEDEALAPPELIRAILKAPVDLLWNGGIGTYVKAKSESNLDAGDPVNDLVRIDGSELRCRVVGEGGNLGLTQLGRIEFAQAGGRLNTDFIDNSGGVDSSDREVNIKILLGEAIKRGELTLPRRNALLAKMTDSVASHVLENNYAQSQALSMMCAHASERLGEHASLIRTLESEGVLDRAIEFLPNDDQIDERRKAGTGLTRPELAIVLSYAKIELFESLLASDIPDEPHFAPERARYFPEAIAKRFGALIPGHRLAREITAMLIASSMINRMGPTFAVRAQEDTGADAAQVARAYAIVRSLFETRKLWQEIEALDGQVQAQVQYDCFYHASRMLRRAVYWLLHRNPQHLDISATVAAMQPGVDRIRASLPRLLCGLARRRFGSDTQEYEGLGMPLGTAQRIAALRLMTQILDCVDLARARDQDAASVAKLHFELGRGLRLDWIREEIERLESTGHWRAMARATLRETLNNEHKSLDGIVLDRAGKNEPRAALGEWMAETNAQIARMKRMFDDMQSSGPLDFATLSIALKEVSRLS